MKKFKGKLFGPFDLDDTTSLRKHTYGKLGGIYFWAILAYNEYLINFIGETNNFNRKTIKHLRNWKSGQYTILNVEKAKQGKHVSIWGGAFSDQAKIEKFSLDKYLEAFREDLKMRKIFILPIIPLPARRERILLETQIRRDLKANQNDPMHSPDLPENRPIQRDEDTLNLIIENPLLLVGLRNNITVSHKTK